MIQEQQVKDELSKMFEHLSREIPLYLFAQPGANDVFSDAARQMIRMFRQVTPKIVLREFDLGHDMAKKSD